MSDHEDGGTHGCIQLMKGFHEHQGGFGILGAGGFVSKNQFWSGYQCAGTGTALFLTAGYLIGEFILNGRYIKYIHNLPRFFFRFFSLFSLEGKRKDNIFPDCESIQQIEILENETQIIPSEIGELILIHQGNVIIFIKNMSAGNGIYCRKNI